MCPRFWCFLLLFLSKFKGLWDYGLALTLMVTELSEREKRVMGAAETERQRFLGERERKRKRKEGEIHILGWVQETSPIPLIYTIYCTQLYLNLSLANKLIIYIYILRNQLGYLNKQNKRPRKSCKIKN